MRHSFALLALIVAPFLATTVGAAQYEAGRHYLELPYAQPVDTGAKIEVREFFWYGCPHCYVLEPEIERWLKKKPANVQFIRTPGAAPSWLVHAQAYYAFEALGKVDKLHGAFFDAYHRGKQSFKTTAEIADFAVKHGVSRKEISEALESFGVKLAVERAKRLNETFGVHTVPTMAVDGRYITNPTMAGGERAAMEVINFLVKKAESMRGRAKP